MDSQKARDKVINLINEEGKVLTVDFLMNQLEIEDCNSHHKSLSQLDSTTLWTLFHMTIDRTSKARTRRMQEMENNRHRINLESRDLLILDIILENPKGWGGECMRCGKLDHQPGQKCQAKNAKCKECHKIGHFHHVCQSKKRATQRTHVATVPQDDDDTHIDENGARQPNPPRINMLKVVNHIDANSGKGNTSNIP